MSNIFLCNPPAHDGQELRRAAAQDAMRFHRLCLLLCVQGNEPLGIVMNSEYLSFSPSSCNDHSYSQTEFSLHSFAHFDLVREVSVSAILAYHQQMDPPDPHLDL